MISISFKLEKLLLSYGDQFIQLAALESGHLNYMRERVGKSGKINGEKRGRGRGEEREKKRRGEEREKKKRRGERKEEQTRREEREEKICSICYYIVDFLSSNYYIIVFLFFDLVWNRDMSNISTTANTTQEKVKLKIGISVINCCYFSIFDF